VQEDVTHGLVTHWRDVAQDVAIGSLDLDDIGTEVTQQLGGKGAQNDRAQVEDAYVV